jgi:hypothetical protein
MLVVETVAKIRREHFARGKGITVTGNYGDSALDSRQRRSARRQELEHRAEKWEPVFRKNDAKNKS